ncbi:MULTISPECIES: hypothetical protein [unclassified Streptomyces]|uniref:hypothetical protein n=1 Tax=unclassified Streptomyces TaxID=2593676 RepID=UPI0033DF2E19
MSTNPTGEDGGGADRFDDLNQLFRPGITPAEVTRGWAAAAERRGITVPQLLDRIARAGRATGRPDELEPPVHDEAEAARRLTLPRWGSDTAAAIGPARQGKTSQADRTRAQLHAAGLAFEETETTDEHGRAQVEFDVQKPESD